MHFSLLIPMSYIPHTNWVTSVNGLRGGGNNILGPKDIGVWTSSVRVKTSPDSATGSYECKPFLNKAHPHHSRSRLHVSELKI